MATGSDDSVKAPASAKCHGHRGSGYWKGYACGARPTVKWKGVWYCKNHVPYAALIEMHPMVGG